MGIYQSCAECGRSTSPNSSAPIVHAVTCSVHLFRGAIQSDYLRPPATIITFDTPKEQAEWVHKLSGGSANTKPRRAKASQGGEESHE